MNTNNNVPLSYFQSKTYEMLSPEEKEKAKNEFIDRAKSNFKSFKMLEKIDFFGILNGLGLYKKEQDRAGNTIVHEVVKLDNKDLFNIVFEDGCPLINKANNEGNTPLYETVLRGNVEFAKELLNRGAVDSINVANRRGFTPLYAAVSRGDPVLVQLLLEAGAQTKRKFGESQKSLLQFASTLKDSTITKLLLKHGMKDQVLVKDTRYESGSWTKVPGHTPLQRAIVAGLTDNVAAMLEDNPEAVKSLNIPENGVTPLMWAARSGNVELVSLLLKKITDQNIITSREGFFTEQDLEACQAEALKNLDSLPIQSIAFPLIIAQNNCNVMIGLNNGKIIKLPNADAKQIKDFILEKKYGTNRGNEAANVLTLYLSPGHGFLRLECGSCDDDKPYKMTKGLYPTGRLVQTTNDAPTKTNNAPPEEANMIFTIVNQIGSGINTLVESIDSDRKHISKTIEETSKKLEEAKKKYEMYKNEAKSAYSQLTQDQYGNLIDDTEYEYSSDQTNALKIMFYLDDEQAKTALSTINDVKFSCSQNPEKSCYYNAVNRNCVDVANEVFTSVGGQGYFADFFSNDQLNYGHLESPSRLWEFKAVNWGYIQSRGIPYYLASGVYQGINNIFNNIVPRFYPVNDLFAKSFPTNFKFQTLDETISQIHVEDISETSPTVDNESSNSPLASSIKGLSFETPSSHTPDEFLIENTGHTAIEAISVRQLPIQEQSPTSLAPSSQPLLASVTAQQSPQSPSENSASFNSHLMLAAVVTRIAIDIFKKISEISTFFGEKVTSEKFSEWLSLQNEKIDHISKGLVEMEESIDLVSENIIQRINEIKKDNDEILNMSGVNDRQQYNQEEKIQLEIYNEEKSKWHKISDKHIDASFKLLEIKEQMKRLTKQQDLPSINYLENLNAKISELNIAYHEIRAQIELLSNVENP